MLRPVEESMWKKSCNCINTSDSDDKCLGHLPGVINACCGHGDPEMAYIMFENGLIIRGFTEVQYDLMYNTNERDEILKHVELVQYD